MTTKTAKSKAKPPQKRKPGTNGGSKQERIDAFVESFLANGGNARQAAIDAGYSPKSADVAAWRLQKDAMVLQQIENRRADLRQKLELTTEGVLKNLAQAVYFDPRKLYNADGTLKPIPELDDDTAMALAGFEVVESVDGKGEDAVRILTKKVKWLDKNQARDQANKILGNYEKDNKQPGAALAAAVDKMASLTAARAKFAQVLKK
ncbi:MAG: terminase small subunit [Rhodoferax sp.]|nr:terminase small subunit [Rhodoferax sp.]